MAMWMKTSMMTAEMTTMMTKNDRRENDNNHVDNDDNDDGDNRGSTSDSSRELKQPRRRLLRRYHLKSELALLQTLSRLFHLVQFVKCRLFFLELSSKNAKWGTFTRCSRATTAKKCTKKRDARAKLLFCQFKPIAFLLFSLPSPSSLLKLHSNNGRDRVQWKRQWHTVTKDNDNDPNQWQW